MTPRPPSSADTGESLTWYATETRSALAEYDRAMRGRGLPASHATNLPSGHAEDGAAEKTQSHVFRVWVGDDGAGAKQSRTLPERPAERMVSRSFPSREPVPPNAARPKAYTRRPGSRADPNLESTDYRARSAPSGRLPPLQGRSREARASSAPLAGSSIPRRKPPLSKGQERILGYAPSTDLSSRVNLSKVKAKVDCGSRAKPARGDPHESSHTRPTSSGRVLPQRPTSSRAEATPPTSGKLRPGGQRVMPIPPKTSRKLDLSAAAPKIDTGRDRKHAPGGGKVTVPMGRMPRSKRVGEERRTACV